MQQNRHRADKSPAWGRGANTASELSQLLHNGHQILTFTWGSLSYCSRQDSGREVFISETSVTTLVDKITEVIAADQHKGPQPIATAVSTLRKTRIQLEQKRTPSLQAN